MGRIFAAWNPGIIKQHAEQIVHGATGQANTNTDVMKKKNVQPGKLKLDKKQIMNLRDESKAAIKGGSFTQVNDTAFASGASRCCPLQSIIGCTTPTVSL